MAGVRGRLTNSAKARQLKGLRCRFRGSGECRLVRGFNLDLFKQYIEEWGVTRLDTVDNCTEFEQKARTKNCACERDIAPKGAYLSEKDVSQR